MRNDSAIFRGRLHAMWTAFNGLSRLNTQSINQSHDTSVSCSRRDVPQTQSLIHSYDCDSQTGTRWILMSAKWSTIFSRSFLMSRCARTDWRSLLPLIMARRIENFIQVMDSDAERSMTVMLLNCRPTALHCKSAMFNSLLSHCVTTLS